MEAKLLASVFSLLSIFVAIYAQSETDILLPNYDVPQYKMRIFKIGFPLELTCNSTYKGDFKLKWEKDGVDVSKVKLLERRYQTNNANKKLTIFNADTSDGGLYSCVANNLRADINAVGAIDIRVPTNFKLLEGEKLTIPCRVRGTHPQISWMIKTKTMERIISNSSDRYILKADENNIQNAILEIENVIPSDKGEYKCTARNEASEFYPYHEANDVAYVRIPQPIPVSQSSRSCCALSLYFVLLLSTVLTFSSLRKY